MSHEARPLGRRPRPVAGLPAVAGDALAKAWLLELLAQRALEDAVAVPTALLAQEAPALCDALVAAVAGDAALGRLLPGGDLAGLAARVGVLTGATGPAGVVAGVEALRVVAHRALRPEDEEDAALAADTAGRLAHVCARLTAEALAGPPETAPVAPAGAGTSDAVPDAHRGDGDPAGPHDRVLLAEDLRGDAASLALERLLGRRGADPVALLAVELDDRDRLEAVEGAEALAQALEDVEAALAAEAGPDGVLVRQQPGRWWLLAPGSGTEAARRLAHRCGGTVTARAPVRHGVPLHASIGVAVCPDDGTTAQALADHADEGVFTARALGVSVA